MRALPDEVGIRIEPGKLPVIDDTEKSPTRSGMTIHSSWSEPNLTALSRQCAHHGLRRRLGPEVAGISASVPLYSTTLPRNGVVGSLSGIESGPRATCQMMDRRLAGVDDRQRL